MTKHMDQLYETIDTSLEHQARQHALNMLACDYIQGKDVFEVGCGSGTLLKLLLQKNYNATGIDISKSQCRLAQKRLDKAGFSSRRIHRKALKDIKTTKTYDTVICIDVLEHIKDDKKALKLLIRLLKPRGTLIILVPAFKILWSKRDEKYGHFRRYTKKNIKKLFLGTELVIKISRYWNFISAILAVFAFKLGLDRISDSLTTSNRQPWKTINACIKLWLIHVERNIAFPFGMSLFVVANKKL